MGALRPAARDRVGPPAFEEPWQAQLHALTLALHQRGAFGWEEWTRALGARLGAPDAAADGSDHHARWLAALVDLLDAKGIAARGEVERLARAWQRAARATPHGTPITLDHDGGGGDEDGQAAPCGPGPAPREAGPGLAARGRGRPRAGAGRRAVRPARRRGRGP